jgi:hypothetical protein
MIERTARRNADFGNPPDHVDDGWFGAAAIAPPASAPEPAPTIAPERVGRHARAEGAAPAFDIAPASTGPRHAAPETPVAAGWLFQPRRPDPWYRTRAVIPAVAALAVAIPVTVVAMRAPEPAPDRPVPVPVPVTTAATSSPLAPSAAPAPPLPDPDPAQELPTQTEQPTYHVPRDTEPTQRRKPEIGVTRTPVTRKPISAVPPAPPTTGRNSSTPGDEPGGWGFW